MNSSRRLVFPALVAAGVLWGTTVPLSKVALGWLGPAWLAFIRFGLAAAILMLVSRSRLRGAWSPAVVISGAIGYGGSVLLQNIGIQRTSVTHGALLIGATPVLVAILAAMLRHSVARPVAWAGFGLSLAGVAVIAGRQGSGSTLGGDGLVLAAQLISAAFTVSQARLLRGRDPIAVTALQLAAAGLAVLPVALMTESAPASPVSPTALLAVVALVLAGTVLPTALFAAAQSKVSADVAGRVPEPGAVGRRRRRHRDLRRSARLGAACRRHRHRGRHRAEQLPGHPPSRQAASGTAGSSAAMRSGAGPADDGPADDGRADDRSAEDGSAEDGSAGGFGTAGTLGTA